MLLKSSVYVTSPIFTVVLSVCPSRYKIHSSTPSVIVTSLPVLPILTVGLVESVIVNTIPYL